MMNIAENFARVKENVAQAAVRSGRRPEDIELIVVTKFVDIARIDEAVKAGARSVGENRAQELTEKLEYFNSVGVVKNFIGQLQTNKVKYIVGNVSLIQSVDRLELAREISRRASAAGIVQDVLVEVNIGGEEQKGGAASDGAAEFIRIISAMPGIGVKGIMCVPPHVGEADVRKYFAQMRKLFEDIKKQELENVEMKHLSMGMSGDYTAAIEEGSNMVRVGTAIFGPRY